MTTLDTKKRAPAEHESSRTGLIAAALSLVVFGGIFIALAVSHVRYEGFLEPMEGDVLQSIQHVCRGEAIYQQPSAEFIPLSYMPLYYYVAAPFYSAFGESFAGPRLLSCLCAVFSGALCCWIAWRESRSATASCIAGTLFFSSYRIMDASLTVALPDSLLLFWLLSGFSFLAYGTRRWHDVAWLVCFTLAFWTKQHGALFFGCAVLYALLFRENQLSKKAILAGIVTGGPVLYFTLGQWMGPGFYETTLLMPGSWGRSAVGAVAKTVFVLGDYVPLLGLLTLFYLRQAWLAERRITPLAWFAVTTLVVCGFTMMADESANNHFVPFISASCIAAAAGLRQFVRDSAGNAPGRLLALTMLATGAVTIYGLRNFNHYPIPAYVGLVMAATLLLYLGLKLAPVSDAVRRRGLAGVVIAGQMAVAFFNPLDFSPAANSDAAFAELRTELQSINGPVSWAQYGYAPASLTGVALARTPSNIALGDVERQNGREAQAEAGLAPFKTWLRDSDTLYVLSNRPLETTPVWGSSGVRWEQVRDFGDRFRNAKQVTLRWYGGNQFPRYLYRKAAGGEISKRATTPPRSAAAEQVNRAEPATTNSPS